MPVKKILVVDDSPTDRQYMLETLAKKGFQVVTAENGEDAIVKAKAELPDLILMDVVMPGLNGYQASTLNWASFSQIAFAFTVTPRLLVTGLGAAVLIFGIRTRRPDAQDGGIDQ